MSLFHIHEWLSIDLSDFSTFAVGVLLESRDQLVVGGLDGIVRVIDPGRQIDAKMQETCLIEQNFGAPILQVVLAKCIADEEQNFIVVLFPQRLSILRFIADMDVFHLDNLYEHRFESLAYNMCVRTAPRSSIAQICVQNMDCSVMVFEAEQMLFNRHMPSSLFPGPIAYASQSESLIVTSGGILSSIKFNVLASASNTIHGKKLSPNWRLNLGDWPIDVSIIETLPVQPSIVVLCRHTILCLTFGGTVRFSIRLQYSATALLVYNASHDAYIQYCVASSTSNILFYADNILIWAVDTTTNPTKLGLCTAGPAFRSMLVISAENRLSITYLGTEPSLFRLPASQTRFIDFEQRKKELLDIERSIKSVTKSADLQRTLEMTCSYDAIDDKWSEENGSECVPSLKMNIFIKSEKPLDDSRLICESKFYTKEKYLILKSTENPLSIQMAFHVKDKPTTDLICNFFLISAQAGELCNHETKLPLLLMCRTTNAQRGAEFKLTLESTETVLDISELFTEFEINNQTAIGFMPYLSRTTISIFTSPKTKRYRIQSNSFDWLYLFTDELVSRILKAKPNASLSSSLPIKQIHTKFSSLNDLQNKKNSCVKEIERLTAQIRGIQSAILIRIKNHRPTAISHLMTFLNISLSEIRDVVGRVKEMETSIHLASDSLSAALNLFRFLTKLNGNEVALDGKIVNGNLEELHERIKWIISRRSDGDVEQDLSLNDIESFIKSGFYGEKQKDLMDNIDEVDEELEDEDTVIDICVSGSLPFTNNAD